MKISGLEGPSKHETGADPGFCVRGAPSAEGERSELGEDAGGLLQKNVVFRGPKMRFHGI